MVARPALRSERAHTANGTRVPTTDRLSVYGALNYPHTSQKPTPNRCDMNKRQASGYRRKPTERRAWHMDRHAQIHLIIALVFFLAGAAVVGALVWFGK